MTAVPERGEIVRTTCPRDCYDACGLHIVKQRSLEQQHRRGLPAAGPSAPEREDLFPVAIDLFPTDTIDSADIVLPAAGFLEFDDLVVSYFHYSISAQVKAAESLGESLPNRETFRRLAARMDFEGMPVVTGEAGRLAL